MEGSGISIPLRFERADIIMKKINGFQITKMTLSGFKCFEEEASFTFGDTTYITASNGKRLVCTCSILEWNQHIPVVFQAAESQIFCGFDWF